MEVRIVQFPETRVAVVEHLGPPAGESRSIHKLIAWRRENHLPPSAEHRSYGLHYNDPFKISPEEYRVDLCVSISEPVAPNDYGVVEKVIPAMRCAVARHLGPRAHVSAAEYLYNTWLPQSGEQMGNFPIIFHYVNVGPEVAEVEMITDVYLPLV